MSEHSNFAAAVMDPAAAIPQGLVTWNGSDPAQRFAVYRNNVAVSLTAALRTTFPVVEALVGTEFFNGMARAYVAGNPPQSALMALYGQSFPAFIAAFAPANPVPYLADVARLEAARVTAHHAQDAPCVTGDEFAALAPEALADARFTIHPSAIILESAYAIVSIWAAHQGMHDLADVDVDAAEAALVVRPDMDVTVTRLAPGLAIALAALAADKPLGDAVQAAATEPAFQPSSLFHTLITTGVVSRLHAGET